MSTQKSKLLSSLKKTLAVGLPVVALSGFVPTTLTVDNALAESEGYTEVVAEAESEGHAEGEAESEGYAEGEAESEGQAEGEAESEGEAEGEAE